MKNGMKRIHAEARRRGEEWKATRILRDSAAPRENPEIAALDAESAEVLQTIRGLI
jgi:hypothetical protein